MGPGQIPGKVIGHVGAREVNATIGWLSQLTAQYKLPQKLLPRSTSSPTTWSTSTQLKERAGLAMVLNVDGFGTRALKIAKYKGFTCAAAALPATASSSSTMRTRT